ncbi:MAG: phage head morphogenesis protein [Proteobacteria bacterium]|nr:phage head morphogenesis protein [Pseudomonadota bacterium]
MATRRSRQRRARQPGEPLTALEQYLDATIRHQVGLLQFSGRVARRVRELLDATESDLRAQVRRILEGQPRGLQSRAQVRRMERLVAAIEKIRNSAWDRAEDVWREEMAALALAEPKAMDGILRTAMPVTLGTTLPPAETLRALVTTTPFEGGVMAEHFSRIRRADVRRLTTEVRIGIVQGESVPQISRRLVGTVRQRGRDGRTEITRKQATTLTRTATSAVANATTREWALANSDVFSVDLFIATLDDRTTNICKSLDGETFPVEQVYPQLPLHWNERSRRLPMPSSTPLGRRPMKPVTERQLLMEFAERQRIAPVRRRADLPFGTKGAFDAFARKRTRELIGTVPAARTYAQFLAQQPVIFQEEALGGTVRARLFRRGKLPLSGYVDEFGRDKTLAEIARDDAQAFRAAGLDPEDFL